MKLHSRASGFPALAGLDFIRDSGWQFYVLEVNPRTWGSCGMARALGVDLLEDWRR